MSKFAELSPDLRIDVSKLIDTRLLVQANSGGGKSYLLRKLLEETHGKVQHIVLDVEGDFSSLREKYDYVLAGKGGDISCHPKHAAYLARKILELKADVIIDLYELKHHERILFVKYFLEAMINVSKDLWHPALVVIDEAHMFCPEKSKSEAMGAVIDLCTRGRKRGFCAVLATQRISKLHKDAAAECNNKLIGRTVLDIDVKRAADELGLTPNRETTELLRSLSPGEFFAFGPAISKTVTKVWIGKTATSHPQAGKRNLSHKPNASSTIKSLLSKMGEVSAEAEVELASINEYKAKVRELERQLKTQPKPVPEFDKKAFDHAVSVVEKLGKIKFKSSLLDLKNKLNDVLEDHIHKSKDLVPVEKSSLVKIQKNSTYGRSGDLLSTEITVSGAGGSGGGSGKEHKIVPNFRIQAAAGRDISPPTLGELDNLGACERKILGFLASQPTRSFTKVQVGAMTGYAHSSGGFNNSLSKLIQSKLIGRTNGHLYTTDDGRSWVLNNGGSTPHELKDWVNKLGACERKIYEVVLESPSTEFTKDEIAEKTDYSAGSGGFNNSISRLSTLGLIQRVNGRIKLNSELEGI